MKTPLKPGSLVTRTEIREMLGVSKQAVHGMEDDLPRPVDVVENGRRPVWRRTDIQKFIDKRRGPATSPTPEPGP